jgi:vitamin B12 transporter
MTLSNPSIRCALLLALAPLPLAAQTDAGPKPVEADAPPLVIVTATRSPQAPEAIAAAVTLIDAAAIARAQAAPVVDILRDVPGVGISRNGGVGAVTGVRLRGAESDQTIVLIDGVKLNDPSSPGGGFDFGALLTGDFDRIEVLRGPQSTLYGSQAIGGVIHVITREPVRALEGGGQAALGALDTLDARGHLRGRAGPLAFALGAGHHRTGGIGAFADGPETDGFSQTAAQARARLSVRPALDLEARLWWARGTVDIDGFPPPNFTFGDTDEAARTELLIAHLGVDARLLDGRLRLRLGANRTDTDRDSLDRSLNDPLTFKARGRNDRLDLQGVFDWSASAQVVAGVEWERARLSTEDLSVFAFGPPLKADVTQAAVHLQAQVEPAPWLTATLGARWTDSEDFGEALNWRGAVAARLDGGATILRLAAADGFKAPTPFQLFSDFGNPRLSPETARSIEAGVERRFAGGALTVVLTGFARDTADQIDFVPCFGPTAICVGRPFGVYDNIARTRVTGLEASVIARLDARTTVRAGGTWMDPRNRAEGAADFNRLLPRRARASGFVSIDRSFEGGAEVGATLNIQGDAFDDAANSRRLKGFTLLNLRASLPVSDNWSLFARIDNATDAAAPTASGYGSLPRMAHVGARAAF